MGLIDSRKNHNHDTLKTVKQRHMTTATRTLDDTECYIVLSGIQRAAQTVLGVYLERSCSRVTSASSALAALNDYAPYKSTHPLTHMDIYNHTALVPAEFEQNTSKSEFSFLRTLTTWHCPRLLLSADRAAVDRQLLVAGPTAANPQQRRRAAAGRDRCTDPAPHTTPVKR